MSILFAATCLSLAASPALPIAQCGPVNLALTTDDFVDIVRGEEGLVAAQRGGGIVAFLRAGGAWSRLPEFPRTGGGVPIDQHDVAIHGNTVAEAVYYSNQDSVLLIVREWDGSAWLTPTGEFIGQCAHPIGATDPLDLEFAEDGNVLFAATSGSCYGAGRVWTFIKGPPANPGWSFYDTGSFWYGAVGPHQSYGYSIEVMDDLVFVGAPNRSVTAPPGAVTVWRRGGSPTNPSFQEVATLEASTAGAFGFGQTVAADAASIDGLLIAIGSGYFNGGGTIVAPRIEVFRWTGSGFEVQQVLDLPAPYDREPIGELDLYAGHLLVGLETSGAALEYGLVAGRFELRGIHTNLAAGDEGVVARTPFGLVLRTANGLLAQPDDYLVRSFCACDTGSPCGNGSPAQGCGNASGTGARLTACGSTRVSADDLRLSASNLPANTWGTPFMGRAGAAQPLGNGQLCLSGALLRYAPGVAAGTELAVQALAAHSAAHHPSSSALRAGQTWSFQIWYRDVGGPCGSSSNLTNAVTITFVP
ncbi:MAG: hypothetical protein R3F49_10880 [Planctomycetota bacterium]